MSTAVDFLRDLPPLRTVVETFCLSPQRHLSQNYLFDFNLLEKIARQGGARPGQTIIEIGPGPGGLTRALLQQGARVLSIEKDSRFEPALAAIKALAGSQFTYCLEDALTFSPPPEWRDAHLVANLPYNIATPLLTGWLSGDDESPWFKQITVMVQKEVGERLFASPGSKAYGRLSVFAQWRAAIDHLFDVPASAFIPAPKVTSSIISLRPYAQPEPCDAQALHEVLHAAFGQRRKMLRTSLKSWLAEGEASFVRAGIDPTARPETLSLFDFIRLSRERKIKT